MKKFILILLFAPLLAFGQNLKPIIAFNGLQYTDPNPKSVVIVLHGDGEKGTDTSLLLRIPFISDINTGKFVPAGRIVIFPQLASGQPGWYANTMNAVVNYAKTFKLPIDITGYSLGGIGVGDNVPAYAGVFRSGASVCGRVDFSNNLMVPAFKAIPSIHYYDPADTRVAYGYSSIVSLVQQLQGTGKTDISLVTLKGYPDAHTIWNIAYDAQHYWTWLNTLDGVQPPITPPVQQPTIWVNDVNTGIQPPILNIIVK